MAKHQQLNILGKIRPHRTRTDLVRHLPVRSGVPGQRAEPLVLRPSDP